MSDFYNKQAKIFFRKDVKTIDRKNKINKFSLLASRFSLLASRFSLLASRFSLLAFTLVAMPFFVNAQVIIKEKVEINPKATNINFQNIPTEPTFTYILSWTPDQYRRGKIQIISCYGDTTDTGWTSEGFATTTVSGKGHHIFDFINERWYYDSGFGWGWYYDSNSDIERKVLFNNQELNLGSTLGSDMGTIGKQSLTMEDFICDSGFVKMKVVPKNWAECEKIGWFPTDQLT